jgi:hypothetical protein
LESDKKSDVEAKQEEDGDYINTILLNNMNYGNVQQPPPRANHVVFNAVEVFKEEKMVSKQKKVQKTAFNRKKSDIGSKLVKNIDLTSDPNIGPLRKFTVPKMKKATLERPIFNQMRENSSHSYMDREGI